MLNLLKGLKDEFGLTLLFIAHDLSVVEHVSDRIAVMYVGKIVEMAETGELLHRPLHPYTEALLSSVPPADPRHQVPAHPAARRSAQPANPPRGCIFHPRCSYAKDICSESEPALDEVFPGHFASCHFARELKLRGVGA